ncbi:AfsR/SARP family transcriptional regulator [Kribbella sp. NBC_01245]|uniref:AfsR/SARP family transcriptional regulator n=1 Tax=Kribbella sp. NBC_01245 TaxID=2903578 RepID=UPI002E2E2E94|nr:AfsR/SARP family transcriptional regulator [Kribbella sp. NBC_01245]
MQFRVLGNVEVETENCVIGISSAPVRGLLATLILEEGRVVLVRHLLESLWDRPPRSARNNLRLHVARLRRQLGAACPGMKERLVTVSGAGGAGYGLRADPAELDVSVFRRLSLRGDIERQERRYADAERTLAEALAIWRGPAFQDCTASEQLRSRFETLEELRLTVRERLAEVRIALGRTTDLVPEIHDLLRIAPFRETSHANLIRARYLAGDVDGAFRTWSLAATTLREELGVEPSAELCDLQHAMLRRDREAVQVPRRD